MCLEPSGVQAARHRFVNRPVMVGYLRPVRRIRIVMQVPVLAKPVSVRQVQSVAMATRWKNVVPIVADMRRFPLVAVASIVQVVSARLAPVHQAASDVMAAPSRFAIALVPNGIHNKPVA